MGQGQAASQPGSDGRGEVAGRFFLKFFINFLSFFLVSEIFQNVKAFSNTVDEK